MHNIEFNPEQRKKPGVQLTEILPCSKCITDRNASKERPV
jgi:hypothetical protein